MDQHRTQRQVMEPCQYQRQETEGQPVCDSPFLQPGAHCARPPAQLGATRVVPESLPRIPSLPHQLELTPLSNEHTQENKTCFSKVGGKEERKGERKEGGGAGEKKNNACILGLARARFPRPPTCAPRFPPHQRLHRTTGGLLVSLGFAAFCFE